MVKALESNQKVGGTKPARVQNVLTSGIIHCTMTAALNSAYCMCSDKTVNVAVITAVRSMYCIPVWVIILLILPPAPSSEYTVMCLLCTAEAECSDEAVIH